MKRLLVALFVLVPALAAADPVTPPGLRKVNHDSTITGAGTLASALGLAPCGSPGQTWIWNGSAYACGTAGGITGSLSSGMVPVASGASTLINGSWFDTGSALSTSSTVALNGETTVTSLRFTSQTSTVTGTNNNVALGATTTVFKWAGTSGGSISGFTGGVSGRVLVVKNVSSGQVLTLTPTGSSAGNQLQNLSSANVDLVSTGSSATYIYNSTSGAWELQSVVSTQLDSSITFLNGANFSNSVQGTTFAASSNIGPSGQDGHFRATLGATNTATCGTSPTITATDAAGVITIGTSSGGNCTFNFHRTYTNKPACTFRFEDATTNNAASFSTTATALSITGAADGKTFHFVCVGNV